MALVENRERGILNLKKKNATTKVIIQPQNPHPTHVLNPQVKETAPCVLPSFKRSSIIVIPRAHLVLPPPLAFL